MAILATAATAIQEHGRLYSAGGPTCTTTEFANAVASNGYSAQPDSKRTTMLASIQRVSESFVLHARAMSELNLGDGGAG